MTRIALISRGKGDPELSFALKKLIGSRLVEAIYAAGHLSLRQLIVDASRECGGEMFFVTLDVRNNFNSVILEGMLGTLENPFQVPGCL